MQRAVEDQLKSGLDTKACPLQIDGRRERREILVLILCYA
jgi:hypothetical protein